MCPYVAASAQEATWPPGALVQHVQRCALSMCSHLQSLHLLLGEADLGLGMQETSGDFMLAFPHVVQAARFCLEVRSHTHCIVASPALCLMCSCPLSPLPPCSALSSLWGSLTKRAGIQV